MKKNKEKAVKSHRGRGKEITGKRVSEEGGKTSLLSMHMSDIGSTLKGSGHNNTENPADWDTRANLLPRSIVILNRDRAIKYLLTYVLIFVIAIAASFLCHVFKDPPDAVELQLGLRQDVAEATVGRKVILTFHSSHQQLDVGLHRPSVGPDLTDEFYISIKEYVLPDEAAGGVCSSAVLGLHQHLKAVVFRAGQPEADLPVVQELRRART